MYFLSVLQVQFWAVCDVEMKLDEKIITYFESCNSPVDKEGYLYKKVRQTGSCQPVFGFSTVYNTPQNNHFVYHR